MPELRKDPITSRWIIISTERAKRPGDFKVERPLKKGGFCPFCYGNEGATPPEVMAHRREGGSDTSGWSVRVVPNKFPALSYEGEPDKFEENFLNSMNGFGKHEVIVETPEHDKDLTDLSVEKFEEILTVYRERLIDLERDDRLKYLMLFKNHGAAGGASLEHTHTQIIALPIIPRLVEEEIETVKKYYDKNKKCIFCEMIEEELKISKRIVYSDDEFVVFCPYAPRFPFEMWIFPRRHMSRFENSIESSVGALAEVLRTALLKLSTLLNFPPYNFMVHTSLPRLSHGDSFHWHIEIIPRLTLQAGFEYGTECYINPTPPEEAAKLLKDQKI